MEKLKEELWKTLEDLTEDDLKKFKWFLAQGDILEDFKGIPVALLEIADRRDTVDLMIQKHQYHGALQVTMKVLEMIGRKDLMQYLQHLPSGPKDSDLLNILDDLIGDEFKDFKWYLKHEEVGDIPPIKERQLSEAERQDVVDLMVQKYEFAGAVKVMKSVLKKISRNDLVRELPNISSGAEGPSTSNTTLNVSEDNREDQLDPDDPERLKQQQLVCRENLTGTSYWQDFTPEVLTESANISYRVRCPSPGVFRCTLTGLVFVMAQKAELLYRTVQWDQNLPQQVGKMAAGLLFNIQSPDGALSQLQLPHCETMDAPLPEGLLSVAHIADDGMSFLEPLEITDTHVVVNVPHLSAFGLVWRLVRLLNIPIEIRGQILLFLRPPDIHDRILDVFLLQGNIPLTEVKAQQGEAVYIRSSSECNLITNRSYSVECDEASTIQPEHEEFCPEYLPNFHSTFEVFLPINQEKVTLMVKDKKGRPVWKRVVNLTGPGPAETPSVPAETKLKSVRRQFIEGVSEPNLHQLLDKLLQRRVINDGEMEFARTLNREAKARQVIDMVRGKGRDASSALIAALCEVDPFLSTELNLQ